MGFAGMNMAGQMGGMNANQLFQMAQNEQMQQQYGQQNNMQQQYGQNNMQQQYGQNNMQQTNQQAGNTWTCSHGHGGNTGKFCSECGEAKPAGVVSCASCGYTPADQSHLPKFCPECGKPF